MSNKIGTKVVVRFRRARKHSGGTMIVRLWKRSLEVAVAKGLPWEQHLRKINVSCKPSLDGWTVFIDFWSCHMRVRYHRLTWRPRK